MLLLKGLIILNLIYIIVQDIKNRKVYWFLFPSLLMLLGYLHYKNVLPIHFKNSIVINIGVIVSIMLILYAYARIIMKRSFFKDVFGLGDALFFTVLAVAFPTISFIILFVFSILFSLFTWLITKKNAKHETIPLAGYMSLFFIFIFLGNWITDTINLYII
ncbi:hypothetical protein [uncultured Aquimarina sp.]|uniref:hypothetical protein n=1 Tax=uncultured Aquimarina sp. TaxID=575652 RepID=UPI002615210B|nr:hypothetical protein [uncultured Aquimarina sp.]